MNRFLHPTIVHVTSALFLVYALSGCSSSSESTKALEKYDSYDYADEATFNRPSGETFRAAIASLEEMGFTLTVSDQNTGEIQGEWGSGELRPEELRAGGDADDSGVGVLEVLGAIVLAILMLFVGTSGETEDDEPEGWQQEHSPETMHVYVVTLQVQSDGPESTIVTVGAARFDYEDDELVGSRDLENKYLNHSLFDRIENHLALGGAQPGL